MENEFLLLFQFEKVPSDLVGWKTTVVNNLNNMRSGLHNFLGQHNEKQWGWLKSRYEEKEEFYDHAFVSDVHESIQIKRYG